MLESHLNFFQCDLSADFSLMLLIFLINSKMQFIFSLCCCKLKCLFQVAFYPPLLLVLGLNLGQRSMLSMYLPLSYNSSPQVVFRCCLCLWFKKFILQREKTKHTEVVFCLKLCNQLVAELGL